MNFSVMLRAVSLGFFGVSRIELSLSSVFESSLMRLEAGAFLESSERSAFLGCLAISSGLGKAFKNHFFLDPYYFNLHQDKIG